MSRSHLANHRAKHPRGLATARPETVRDSLLRAAPFGSTALDRMMAAAGVVGSGLLRERRNQDLRDKFNAARLSPGQYCRQVLSYLYRHAFHRASGVHGRQRYFPGLEVPEAMPDLGTCLLARHMLTAVDKCLGLEQIRKLQRQQRTELFSGLAEAYEPLLDCEPLIDTSTWTVSLSAGPRSHRKAGGCFYTPPTLIDALLDSALAPAVAEALHQRSPEQALLALRICDPACGTGGFLVAAARQIAAQLARQRVASRTPTDQSCQAALRDVIGCCIHGVDIDARAVELCRMRLWLESARLGSSASPAADRAGPMNSCRRLEQALAGHIVCDDSLKSDPKEVSGAEAKKPAACDVILGNPPYGALLSKAERVRMNQLYPLARSAGNTAGYFLVRCRELAGPAGRIGLVMPKSITYSHAWESLRSWLRPCLTHAVDVSKAWKDVLLEQVLITYRPPAVRRKRLHRPRLGQLVEGQLRWQSTNTARLMERLGTIPTGLSESDELIAKQMFNRSTGWLGERCVTRRGMPLQKWTHPTGAMPVLAGKDMASFQAPRPKRFLRLGSIDFSTLRLTQPPQVAFQNIVAHLTRPADHIHLIGTVVEQEIACLDTVNLLTPTDGGLTPYALAGLLMSDLINWFVYVCVYNRAVRTMHFDGCFLRKIPVPSISRDDGLDASARRLCDQPRDRAAWQALNACVYGLYGIPNSVAATIRAERKPRWA